MGRLRLIRLVAWIAILGRTGPAAPGEGRVLEVGYSAELLPAVGLDDARAATAVWISHLVENTDIEASTDVRVYTDTEGMLRSLEARETDILIISPLQYLEISDSPLLQAVFIGRLVGNVGKRYVLLVPRDTPSADVAALRGKRLLIHRSGLGEVAPLWLQTYLLRRGMPEPERFFESQEIVERPSQAVLPVLFGQADVCLIALHEYETMCELNPQLRRDLRELDHSPRFARAPICLRPAVYEELSDVFDESILSLHADPQGQQMLTLFGVDQVVPFEPQHLESLVGLVDEYARLRGVPSP